MAPACSHEHLRLDVSPHAAQAGFQRPPLAKRRAATTPSGRATGSRNDITRHIELEALFPGPLVLPGDDLALDPKQSPQSLRSWTMDKQRNPVTQERKTIYFASVPHISFETGMPVANFWTIPSKVATSSPPKAEQVRAYLEAFYHPLPVKLFAEPVRFVAWRDKKKRVSFDHIGLQIGDGVTRITTRPCPDRTFFRQLNLNDMLDAAIEALPADAYALVMLVDPDLYEDDDDEFCCGRAYGNSRVAIVSTARYDPLLDRKTRVDSDHGAWPLSHCETYVQRLCKETAGGETGSSSKSRKSTADATQPSSTDTSITEAELRMAQVIKAALSSNPTITPSGPSPSDDEGTSVSTLWLSRVARAVAHELGHCFCLDHCAYYACAMQGTASVREDLRQPPYLCPVCLAKLARAVRDVYPLFVEAGWMVERYRKLQGFCELWEGRRGGGMFAAFRCWLEMRIQMLMGNTSSCAVKK
ncbi:hypothetical protein C8A03DRAFT_44471 [Achaetomium macrosporum]|uniref:Archaemetzincin-2 n=1 Tax=Achaetomium macrosporum TaxID=79813 RepID=A0AAN7HAH4_9PEZI|nr:hypothetical protein C8A03DRAFT_44471 [Achaetomium macrosporum]